VLQRLPDVGRKLWRRGARSSTAGGRSPTSTAAAPDSSRAEAASSGRGGHAPASCECRLAL